jgi:hypothetical protein
MAIYEGWKRELQQRLRLGGQSGVVIAGPFFIDSTKRRGNCETPVRSPPMADINIDYFGDSRFYLKLLKRDAIIREISLDGKVDNLVYIKLVKLVLAQSGNFGFEFIQRAQFLLVFR